MKRLLHAATLAMAVAQPLLAQVQLAEEVASKLAALGIDQTLVVSEDQLLQIEAVLNDASATDADKTVRINAIVGQ